MVYCQSCRVDALTDEEENSLRNNEYFCKQCSDYLEQYYQQQYSDYLIEKASDYWNKQYEDAEVFVYED